MKNYWSIYHEGRQISAPLPESVALKKYKELSNCLTNLDLRMLQRSNDIVTAREVRLRNMRVVGD